MPLPYAENANLSVSKMQTISSSDADTGMGTGAREDHSVWL